MNEQTLVEKKRNSPPRGAGGAKKVRRYTAAEKLKAVRLCLEEGFSLQQVCDEMGMAHSGLSHWVSRYRQQGEAGLQPRQSVMRKMAALLSGHPELKIQVVGHTDNVPIRSRFPSNWELSTARALAAVHFLTEKAGVDPRRLGAVGYGEFRPIADNATAEGRSKNRRIAIAILPDVLAGVDTSPAAKPILNGTP